MDFCKGSVSTVVLVALMVLVLLVVFMVRVVPVVRRMLVVPVLVAMFGDKEPRGGHTRAQYARRAHVIPRHRKAAERALQLGKRQPGVEERPEHHVARYAGEAVEVQQA